MPMSEQEAAFRFALRTLLRELSAEMPAALQDDITAHLTRTDNAGRPLCFASPLRERLVGDLLAWLQPAHPEVLGTFQHALEGGIDLPGWPSYTAAAAVALVAIAAAADSDSQAQLPML
jgi:hypothetical protein